MRPLLRAAAAAALVLLASSTVRADAGADAADAAHDIAPAPPVVEPQASAAPPAVPETLPVASGFALRLTAPAGWTGYADSELAAADLSQVEGARVVVSRSWRGPRPTAHEPGRRYRDSMFLMCVQAPVTEWAPGLEQLVFEEMNQKMRDELGKYSELDAFEPAAVERTDAWFRQTFKAHGELGEGHRRGQVRQLQAEQPDRPHNHARNVGLHLLTVPAGSQDMVACSLACGETERPEQKTFLCDSVIAGLEPLGELTAEPAVTTLGRLVVGLRLRPWLGAGAGFGLLMALVGAALTLWGLVVRARAAKARP
jgi:hypothetical protein